MKRLPSSKRSELYLNYCCTGLEGTVNNKKTMTEKILSTPASKLGRTQASTPGGPKVKEEKIVVTVRLRPLSKREQAVKDIVAWECIDDQTIVYKPPPHNRAAQPASFTFDRVFGPACLTEAVYEEGVKNVALSALMGINATIFAYGQTSSGKTYTMRGITEKAVTDIYNHILNTPERDFTIKISGLEIYNENVRDLLNSESGRNLKLLDDPEKGTVVEKLVEERATNDQHLRHLISICEAQRQVGETALNDNSSRSHQIIRLTIQSTLRENSDCIRSYVSTLNFVDLAGSERASQTHADGARLREGCHINLSLMTLTTVIRKLSASGKRSSHIPYRDSKLTRILQHSLGGNARTAIICTLSPALSHVEQTRNTLFFATRAKEVTNSAQVNMVVSDKQLVKHLQKEVARLEAELHTPDPSSEKDLKIQQMEKEIEELKRQRDIAQSQVDELLQKKDPNHFESPPPIVKCLSFSGTSSPNINGKERDCRTRNTMGRQSIRQSSTAPFTLMHEIRKLEQLQEQLGAEANRALEVLQKEVACHRLGNQDAAETIAKLQAEIREMCSVRTEAKEVDVVSMVDANKSVSANLKEEITRLHTQGSTIADLEEQLENVQRSIDQLVMSLPRNNEQPDNEATPKSKHQSKKKKLLPLASSNNMNRPTLLRSPCSPLSASRQVVESETENRAPANCDIVSAGASPEPEQVTPTKGEESGDVSSKEGSGYRRSSSVNMKKMQKMFQNAAEENVRSIRAYVTELKERVAKLQYQKQLLVCQVLELEANEAAGYNIENNEDMSEAHEPVVPWSVAFREQRQQIIELWDVCHVSLIHRTQFYLLFKGDPADQIYMEVELRRLTWLQQHLAELGNASPAYVGDEPAISLSSSIRALKREREFLAKRVTTRLSAEEREALYIKWGVPLDGRQRRLHFIYKLWTDPHDPKHVKESAEIVAKLVGFCEGGKASKEMFELNFALPTDKRPWIMGWNPISNLLHL
ncbi:Kinesin-like protein nack1 [Ancistrocladus abbreviatus]